MKRITCMKRKSICGGVALFLVIPITVFILLGKFTEKLPQKYSALHQLTSLKFSLLNLTNFAYIINNNVCDKIDVFTIVIIHSHPANRDRRDCMRQSIPDSDLRDIGVRRVFLLARAEWDDQVLYKKTSQETINDENDSYKDIIQGNFKEHYHNLTYKHLMGLRWASGYCPQAKFILKMDDDIIVDLYQFRDRLKYRHYSRTNLILGLLQVETKPIRDPKSKWFVSELNYAGDVYPNYVSGWAYAMSMDAAVKIVNLSSEIPFQWIDDLFVTGIIAEKGKVFREGLNSFYTIHSEYLRCCLELPRHADYFCDFYAGPSEGDLILMGKVLQHARSCFEQTCIRRNRTVSVERTCVKIVNESPISLGIGIGEVIKISA